MTSAQRLLGKPTSSKGLPLESPMVSRSLDGLLRPGMTNASLFFGRLGRMESDVEAYRGDDVRSRAKAANPRRPDLHHARAVLRCGGAESICGILRISS